MASRGCNWQEKDENKQLTTDSCAADSSVDTTETPYRYAAYATRVRTILLSAHRYVAYTSDIGESFRPIAHPWIVRSAYGISWLYLFGDVSHEGYKAYLRNWAALAPAGEAYKDASELTHGQIVRGMATGNLNQPSGESKDEESNDLPTTEISLAEDYRMVMAKRATFQSIASMGLPAFTIHRVVKHSSRMMRNVKSPRLRTWAPIGVSFYTRLFLFLFIIVLSIVLVSVIAGPLTPMLISCHLYNSSASRSSLSCRTSSTTPSN